MRNLIYSIVAIGAIAFLVFIIIYAWREINRLSNNGRK